jgi:hypothetical protein
VGGGVVLCLGKYSILFCFIVYSNSVLCVVPFVKKRMMIPMCVNDFQMFLLQQSTE